MGDIIQNASAPEDENTMEIVKDYIDQLHRFDMTADKFRYPTDKNLNFHFIRPKELDFVTVGNFFEELATFLSGVDAMISANNEWKADMQAEYSSYDNY